MNSVEIIGSGDALRAAMRSGKFERFAQRDVTFRLRFKSHLVAKRYRAPLQCHTLES